MNHDCGDDGRHILTDDDRKFLSGKKELTKGSASNRKMSIRQRFRCGLYDMKMLSTSGGVWNLNYIAEDVNPNSDAELYDTVVSTISLMYSIAERSDMDTEHIFEDAIRQTVPDSSADNNYGPKVPVPDVDVQIDIDYPPLYEFERVKEKIQHGELPTDREVGMLILNGDDERTVKFGEEEKQTIEWIKEFSDRRETGGHTEVF